MLAGSFAVLLFPFATSDNILFAVTLFTAALVAVALSASTLVTVLLSAALLLTAAHFAAALCIFPFFIVLHLPCFVVLEVVPTLVGPPFLTPLCNFSHFE